VDEEEEEKGTMGAMMYVPLPRASDSTAVKDFL
jgi:hypothetical protein